MAEIFLINEGSGLGAAFDILDYIEQGGRKFAVLLPQTAADSQIADALTEEYTLSKDLPSKVSDYSTAVLPDTACENSRNARVCILEVSENSKGESKFLRVGAAELEKLFEVFKERNRSRFRFE